MDARAGALARGVKPVDIRHTVQIRDDTAHKVMLSGMDRDGLRRDVDPFLLASGVDGRETVGEEVLGHLRHVEQRVFVAGPFHIGKDRPRHDIPRSEILQPMDVLHNRFTAQIQKRSALAAYRLADQEQAALVAVGDQGRRVKLHHLHKVGLDARTDARRDAVADRTARIGGIAVNMPDSARREQDIRANDDLRRAVVDQGAHDRVVFGQNVDQIRAETNFDIRTVHHELTETLGGLAPRGVAAAVHDPAAGMSALAPDLQFPLRVGVERNVHFNKLADILGSLGDKDAHRLLVAEPGSGFEGVGDVRFDIVGGRDDRGDPALCEPGIALFDLVGLGDDHARERLGDMQGGVKPRDAAPDDQNVGLDLFEPFGVKVQKIASHSIPLSLPVSFSAR